MRPKNLVGMEYGLLTVLEMTSERKHGQVVWMCQCACGELTTATSGLLKEGWKKSCGCLKPQATQVQPVLKGIRHITVTKPYVVQRIIEEAAISGTTPSEWAEVTLEDWILKHRSGLFPGDPTRHDARETDRTAEYFD